MNKMRLRHLALITNSNVDKIVAPGEETVRLCNYVDVYKRDRITADMDFMLASATAAEIAKFGLKVGDVIITKDSEDRHDIAVPAYVAETLPDLVCGYHLALLRARLKRIRGDFLFWALQAKEVREEFSNAAGGVTRFGLTLDGIKSVAISCPSLDVQKATAKFLDRETTLIDRLIRKKERLIELLAYKRLSASCGLADGAIVDAPMSEACSWFGRIPVGWNVRRAKLLFRESDRRSTTGQEDLLTVSHITGVTLRSEKQVNMFEAESNEGYKLVAPRDLVINTMWAWMGAMGVSRGSGLISPSYGIYSPTSAALLPDYVDVLVRSRQFIAEATRRSKGIHSSRLRLYPDAFLDMQLPVPPVDVQERMLVALHKAVGSATQLKSSTLASIDRLREFRAALITAAVTGQIDVSNWRKRGNIDRRLEDIEKAMRT